MLSLCVTFCHTIARWIHRSTHRSCLNILIIGNTYLTNSGINNIILYRAKENQNQWFQWDNIRKGRKKKCELFYWKLSHFSFLVCQLISKLFFVNVSVPYMLESFTIIWRKLLLDISKNQFHRGMPRHAMKQARTFLVR